MHRYVFYNSVGRNIVVSKVILTVNEVVKI